MKRFINGFLFENYLKHQKVIFIALFIELVLVYTLTKTPLYGLGDCSFYYSLAQSFWINNGGGIVNFSILNPEYIISGNAKGYLFPMILSFPYRISTLTGINPEFSIQILFILFFLLIFLFIVPRLYQTLSTNGKDTVIPAISIVIFSQIFLFFWYGYLLFPLSDIPAAVFFLLGTIFFLDKKRTWYQYFIAGVLFTAAYNTRTIYLYAFILFVAYLIFSTLFNKHNRIRGVIGVAMLLLSFILLEIPQLYVNINKYSIYSLMVQNGNVLKQLLIFGYYIVAFLSAYGNNGSAYGVIFAYPEAMKVLNSFEFDRSYSGILSLFLHDIKISISVLFLKIYSSFDIWYSSTYIPEKAIGNFSAIYRNINYIILFFGLGSLIFMKFNLKKVILIIMLLTPSLIAYLGSIETRYFVINFILIYMIVSIWLFEGIEVKGRLQLRIKSIVERILSKKLYLIIFVAVFVIYMLLSNYINSVIISFKL